MNILQKRAWIELVFMAVCTAVTAVSLAHMVRMNTKGVTYIIISVAVGMVTGLVAYLHNVKIAARFDEREKSILRRANMLGAYAFTLAIGCTSFIAFFLVGGAGRVSVYVLPAAFLGALITAQFVQSAAILIQFAREQIDG